MSKKQSNPPPSFPKPPPPPDPPPAPACFSAYRNRKLAQQGDAFKSTVPCAGCGRPMVVCAEVPSNNLVGVCIPCNHVVPVGVSRS